MANGISIQITADDKATPALDRISKALTKAFEPVEGSNRQLDRLGDNAGLTKVGRAIKDVASEARSAASSFGRWVPALSVLTSAASIGGALELSKSYATLGTSLSNTAAGIGMPIQRLQVLQNTARMAGLSSDAMASSLGGLANTLNDARWGRPGGAMAAMLARHFGMGNLAELAKQPEQAMLRLADVAQKVNRAEGPQATARLLQYFGVSQELLPLLIQGASAMRERQAEAERMGVIDQQAAEASKRLTAAFAGMEIAGENLGATIGEALAPVLVPLLTDLGQWVSAHRDDVGGFFREVSSDIGSWVQGGGIQRTAADLKAFGTGVDDVVTKLGGWKTAGEAALGVWTFSKVAPVLASVLQLSAAVATLRAGGTAAAAVAAGASAGAAGAAGGAGAAAVEGGEAAAVGSSFLGGLMRFFGPAGAFAYGMRPRATAAQAQEDAAMGRVPRDKAAAAQESYDFWTKTAGYTPAGAAAMMAQENQETGFDWTKRGDKVNGVYQAGGAFQWHQERRDNLQRATGIDVWDPRTTHQQQLAAMWAEQRDSIDALSGNAYDRIRNATSSDDATRLGVTLVERPRDTDAEIQQRSVAAAGFLDRYGSSGSSGLSAGGEGLAPPAKLDTGAAGKDGADGAAGQAGKVRHVIEFQNAPPGTTHRVEENTAGVDVQGPRVDLAFPLF